MFFLLSGMELHVLRDHFEVNQLQFLPYHFLLATIGKTGYLKYQDTSTGQFLCEWNTKLVSTHIGRHHRTQHPLSPSEITDNMMRTKYSMV